MSVKDWYTTSMRSAATSLATRIVVAGHITPNNLTIAGLILSAATIPLIVRGHFIMAALVLLAAGICDMLDGAVARISQNVTPFGAFLDSTSDRLSEGFVLMGIGLWYAIHDSFFMLGVVFVVLICSFLVSYARARAEAVGIECKVGFASRPERLVGLMIGLILARFHVLVFMLLLLAVLTTWTVIVRILHVRKQMLAPPAPPA
jgi:CDP-diacylglycerol--glycerol-3-phosphate 3-phosphatidyltransferase